MSIPNENVDVGDDINGVIDFEGVGGHNDASIYVTSFLIKMMIQIVLMIKVMMKVMEPLPQLE